MLLSFKTASMWLLEDICYLLTRVKALKAKSGGKYRSEFQPRKKPKKEKNLCNETAKFSIILLP